MWSKDLLALDDIAVAYGGLLWAEYGRSLMGEKLQGKFKILEDLRDGLSKTDSEFAMKPDPNGFSGAGLDFVRENFWKREVSLGNDQS